MRKKGLWLVAILCLWISLGSSAAEWTGMEWNGSTEGEYPNRNCDIVSIGREAARVDSIPYQDIESAVLSAENYQKERSAYYQLLSQTNWRFAWFENPASVADGKEADFWREEYDASDWEELFVPSVWQTEGYDHPIYTNTTQKFARQFGNEDIGYPRDLPTAPTVYNPVGLYRHTFTVPEAWRGRRVYIDFEGVNAAMYLWVNGEKIGYAEDSFTTHEFDLTDCIRFGAENTLAVQVYRWCDGSWLEDQDMFDLSGIFRDVYLYATPQVRLRDYVIVTDFDDTFTDSTLNVSAFVRNYTNSPETASLRLHLLDGDGAEVPLTAAWAQQIIPAGEEQEILFSIPVTEPRKWSAEDPYLYTLVVETTTGQGVTYEGYRVGFRKITYKTTPSGWYEDEPTDHDLIRINGQPISFRGVNRHETHPELGYALTREIMEQDIRILLENNINAVRTSHYPNHPYWYYLCDRYGIYVVDEANVECHSNMIVENERLTDYLSSAIIDREYSMVRRDRNHASVVMWSLGNENKNPEILRHLLVDVYEDPEGESRILHQYTKDRPWHYEQAGSMTETGIDVRSGMYALPEVLEEHGQQDGALPMIECEYEHAMGNSEGNFDEYWAAFDQYRNLQGGFIWDYIDQSIALTSEDGQRYFGFGGDYGETLHDGNFCANGLLLPDRTVQPEMAEVKYHYQPVKFIGVDVETGWVEIRNFYLFTDPAERYDLHWTLLMDDIVLQEGVLSLEEWHVPAVEPSSNQPGTIQVQIPYTLEESALKAGREYFLNLTMTLRRDEGLLQAGHVAAMEQFQLHPQLPQAQAEELPAVILRRENGLTLLSGEDFAAAFDETSGRLIRYEADGCALIVPGEGPSGSFFRSATDNDAGFGYGLFVFTRPWKQPGAYVVDEYQVGERNGYVDITVCGHYPALNGTALETCYTVYGDGAIRAQVVISPGYNESLVYIPVAGMQLTVPSDYENMLWFGRGPEENYIDRYKGTRVGRYATTVTDNFVPYLETGETGNRTGVRWLALTDDTGFGLLAAATSQPMEASALHYTADELDRRVHPYQLNPMQDTILRLNAIQIGVGGDNAWSRIVPHEPYLPHAEQYSYGFVLSPLRPGQDAGDLSAHLRLRPVSP